MTPDDELKKKLEAVVDATVPEGRAQVDALIASIVNAGGTSEKQLTEMLHDRWLGLELRSGICWMIPRLGIAGAEKILTPLMSDPSEKIREEAAAALGLVLHEDSVEALLKTVELDSSKPVRLAALHALGILSPPRAAADVMQVLLNPNEDAEVRADAAEALAHFVNEGIVDVLIDCLGDRSPLVRYSSAYALGQQGDAKALPRLIEIALHDRDTTPWGSVASCAFRAIEAIKDHNL